MFDALVRRSPLTGQYRCVPASARILEDLLAGQQFTVDGCAHGGKVVLLGAVDSVFFPAPCRLSGLITRSPAPPCAGAHGPDRGRCHPVHPGSIGILQPRFYRREDDSIWIMRINGRMASQFAPLYRMLRGIDIMPCNSSWGWCDPGGATPGKPDGPATACRRALSCGAWTLASSRAFPRPTTSIGPRAKSPVRSSKSW